MNATTKWILGAVIIAAALATMVFGQAPIWLWILLGALMLSLLYIFARLNSRYDPLDPRFGSCIPPINTKPRDH
jgi:hypothetical protein